MKKTMFNLCVLLTIAGLLVGCRDHSGEISGDGNNEHSNKSVSVSVVVGAHSNANVISANAEEIEEQVYQCTYTYGTVSLIRADGKPEVFLKAKIKEPATQGLSESKLNSIAEGYKDEILSAFNTEGLAKYAEVDTLDAIRLAANSLKGVENGDKYLVIADTGLSTTGYLNFRKKDLFNTPTNEIINALYDARAIPELDGINVIWLYAGQVADPQPRLSEVQKAKLVEIWSAILEEAGASSYDFRVDSASAVAYTGLPEVSVVNADDRDISVTPIETIVLDSENVSFVGDKAIFLDEHQAKKVIGSVAKTLLDNPSNRVYVVGCTASSTGREDFCQSLSEKRAQAVVNVLKDYGVPDSQVIAIGLGDNAPWHIPDLDKNGHQIEEYAQKNRCVVIIDSLDPEYGSIVAAYSE